MYPPESATLALLADGTDDKLASNGLKPLSKVLDFSAYLIANRNSWDRKNLSEIIATFEQTDVNNKKTGSVEMVDMKDTIRLFSDDRDVVRLALADGHQQKPTAGLLLKAGINFQDYP